MLGQRNSWFSGRGVVALVCCSVIACSDDAAPLLDGSGGGDGGSGLWRCTNPGQACNAHDTCAINPICGQDGFCHPSILQNCDDGLGCTEDKCGGPGLCVNTPKSGWCAVLVKSGTTSAIKCYPNGAPHPTDPCQKCDTSKDGSKWSDASGAACDDENTCTLNDVCKDGQCQGTYFGNKCGDGLQCTADICDGKGGCSNKLQSGHCMIDNKCYKDKETDSAGCAVCDASDPLKWTTLPNLCKIGATCYKPGDRDTTGCGVCDPTKSATGWSQSSDTCWIGGGCYKQGDKDPSGCGSCDPAKSATGWTAAASNCLIGGTCHQQGVTSTSGCGICDAAKSAESWSAVTGASTTLFDFEAGLGGFSVDPAVNKVGWQIASARAKGGKQSLYYGDPTSASYNNGAANKGKATSSAVTLPAAKKAALIFWLYLDTESAATFDVLTIKAGGSVVWTKSAATLGSASYQTWVPVEVDLSSKAGSSIMIEISFDTIDAWSNGGEGVYIDDLRVLGGCGA